MSSVELLTYKDALDHLTDWQAANPDARTNRFARRAIIEALRDLAQAHHWSYLYKQDFITTVAPYSTGTIEYDHTGGTYERLVTLTDGVVPDWAADATLRIGTVDYTPAERKSDSQFTLDIRRNPGQDVAAGTSYTLFQDRYVLPADLWTIDQIYPNDQWVAPGYVHPRNWLASRRINDSSSDYPIRYTVMGSDDYQGAMELALDPYPASAITLAFIYSRRPRRITVEDAKAGSVTVAANGTTVSGDGTSFTDSMVGSLIRLSSSVNEFPTGREGANPYAVERAVIGVTDSSTLTIDQAVSEAYTGVKYVVSDPLDIDVGVMGSALLRCAEAHLGRMLRLEDRRELVQHYDMALTRAREADSRSTANRSVGGTVMRPRYADMPLGPDVD